jgi:DNA-binding NtrC family response regulator
MSQFEFPAEIIDLTEILGRRATHNSESFPILEPQTGEHPDIPNGLVVSANDRIRGTLGEALLLCGMAPTFSTSLAESGKHLKADDLSVVICEDLLPDGRYSDLLQLQQQSANNTPVIVVSRTGDWEEYFEALERGAHDFLAYPLIPGELQRILKAFLAERRQQCKARTVSHL